MEVYRLGFTSNYSCEIAPEFPGSGDWGSPIYRFVQRPESLHKFAQVGKPFVIRISRIDGSDWVGFLAGGIGGLTGVYVCPNPDQVCVVVDGSGYLVDTRAPASYQLLPVHPVLAVERVSETASVLCSGFIDMLLIDEHGLLWVSDRLCLDDLQVRNVDHSTISCTGRYLAEDETWFSVSLETGRLVSGEPFRDVKGQRRRYWHRSDDLFRPTP